MTPRDYSTAGDPSWCPVRPKWVGIPVGLLTTFGRPPLFLFFFLNRQKDRSNVRGRYTVRAIDPRHTGDVVT